MNVQVKPLTKLEQIETKLAEARQKQSDLKGELAAIDDRAAELREKYKSAVEAGESEAKLDVMDQELYKLDRQHTRIEIRYRQAETEIEQRQLERAEARAEEELQKYQADVADALVEAKSLEKVVQVLVAAAAVHSERLKRMRAFCEGVSIPQIPYKLQHLERRISTIFAGNNSVNKVYKLAYDEILAGNIESVSRQMNRSAPSTEIASGVDAAEQEAEQQSAVNN